jgi:predicted Zn-dependent protease
VTKEQATLAAALRGNHVALATGIDAAVATGKPISAQYEVENGKLHLSVFTEKAGAFTEVFVDHQTGKVAKTEKITAGEDLKDAKVQNRAIAKVTLG